MNSSERIQEGNCRKVQYKLQGELFRTINYPGYRDSLKTKTAGLKLSVTTTSFEYHGEHFHSPKKADFMVATSLFNFLTFRSEQASICPL